MCDFRQYTGRAIDKRTNEEVSIPYRDQAAINEQIRGWIGKDVPVAYQDHNADFGVYQVVATGAHFAFFNGEEWEDCYNNERYTFLFEEDGTCLGHLL